MKRLIFVYNAKAGLFNQIADYVHKIVSPQTYECNLCQITFGNIGMKEKWKEFIASLPIKSDFLHKDELEAQYSISPALPVILMVDDNQKPAELITASEINKVRALEELMILVESKVVDI